MFNLKGVFKLVDRCSNCHAGILENEEGQRQCVNNYTNCDYSINKPIVNNYNDKLLRNECVIMFKIKFKNTDEFQFHYDVYSVRNKKSGEYLVTEFLIYTKNDGWKWIFIGDCEPVNDLSIKMSTVVSNDNDMRCDECGMYILSHQPFENYNNEKFYHKSCLEKINDTK